MTAEPVIIDAYQCPYCDESSLYRSDIEKHLSKTPTPIKVPLGLVLKDSEHENHPYCVVYAVHVDNEHASYISFSFLEYLERGLTPTAGATTGVDELKDKLGKGLVSFLSSEEFAEFEGHKEEALKYPDPFKRVKGFVRTASELEN